MKKLIQRLAASFRLRLTLFLVLVMGVLIGAYGFAVSRKLEANAIERVERRLMGVASRWTPLQGRTPEVGRPGLPPREHRERGVYIGMLSVEGDWIPALGDWPEALVVEWREVVAAKGDNWPQLLLPERPPPAPGRRLVGRGPGPFEGLPPEEMDKFAWLELSAEGEPWLVLTGRLERGFVVFADNIRYERATAAELGRVQTIYLPLLMLFVLVIGWIFSTRALSPVNRLASAMARTSDRNLGHQLPPAGAATEFQELIRVFNAMTERLRRSFQQASRFSADAAHELKTPLTVLQGELEAALQMDEAGSEAQQRHRSMLDEVSRLRGITERLLLLARADAGSLLGEQTAVSLDSLVGELVEDLEATAPDLKVEPAFETIALRGDPVLLRQAIYNLFSNAQKYNCPGGRIGVRLFGHTEGSGVEAVLEVSNTGETISPDARPHLFDRFFRIDSARSREVDGFGLGLSLSREIARAHGGDLALVRSDAEGTLFRLTLPIKA